MDRQNVLVPGAGGAAGIGAIKSLRLANFQGKIVATDSDKLSAGLYLADNGYVVPPADSPSFLQEVMKIIKEEQIDIILPTSGFDIIPYSRNKKILESENVIAAMSDYEVIDTCLNKQSFYHKLRSTFSLPYTTRDPDQMNTFPCIAKPIRGKGSRNIFTCYNKKELEEILSKHNDLIIQEYLPGKEYTIDVLSDLTGTALVAILRERIEIRAGISVKGKIVLHKAMQEECLQVAEFLGIRGPSCIQMKCDREGVPRIIEVNPRLGGGTILTAYAGVNFPELIVKIANAEKIEISKPREITMIRYYEEVILSEKGEMLAIASKNQRGAI